MKFMNTLQSRYNTHSGGSKMSVITL